MKSKTNRRIALFATTAIALGAAITGCGGRQQPTASGHCHPWREWVPPARDSNGQWQDGYCRGERPPAPQS